MPLPVELVEQLQQLAWPEPWRCLSNADTIERERLNEALRRQLFPRHALFKFRNAAQAIASRDDCDDVLYWVEGAEKPFALVHLTWSPFPEQLPEFPWAVHYGSLAEFSDSQLAEG